MTVLNYALHRLCLHLTLVLITAIPSEGEGAISGFAQEGNAFLEQYCFGCHTGERPAAGFADVATVKADIEELLGHFVEVGLIEGKT